MKVVYWSSTGNTERMAEMLGEEIKNAGGEAEVCELSTVSPADLAGEDVFALGASAMGDEELDEGEVEPFVEELEKSVSGKKVALFGSYDWGDGEWMRKWEERMKEAGAEVVGIVIANNEPGDEDQANLAELAKKLV
ncbi:flavodoxin [Candidatus Merdisoma sp. HCP28S3_D10]|uniref:flavodoxin n=1 Tax=unclassified Candidatus Merdisoma TaxID=3099611 RepID=UPI003F8B5FA9